MAAGQVPKDEMYARSYKMETTPPVPAAPQRANNDVNALFANSLMDTRQLALHPLSWRRSLWAKEFHEAIVTKCNAVRSASTPTCSTS